MIPSKGDRIRLVFMRDDPDPVPVGMEGTVSNDPRTFRTSPNRSRPGPWAQVDVDWDNGRTLKLIIPPDEVEILERVDDEKVG